MRPEKGTELLPARLVRVNVPCAMRRTHRLARRSERVGATQRLPVRRPERPREMAILTVAASDSAYWKVVPRGWRLARRGGRLAAALPKVGVAADATANGLLVIR